MPLGMPGGGALLEFSSTAKESMKEQTLLASFGFGFATTFSSLHAGGLVALLLACLSMLSHQKSTLHTWSLCLHALHGGRGRGGVLSHFFLGGERLLGEGGCRAGPVLARANGALHWLRVGLDAIGHAWGGGAA